MPFYDRKQILTDTRPDAEVLVGNNEAFRFGNILLIFHLYCKCGSGLSYPI
jgi:hypothetical protein